MQPLLKYRLADGRFRALSQSRHPTPLALAFSVVGHESTFPRSRHAPAIALSVFPRPSTLCVPHVANDHAVVCDHIENAIVVSTHEECAKAAGMDDPSKLWVLSD